MAGLSSFGVFSAPAPQWCPFPGKRDVLITDVNSWGTQPTWQNIPATITIPFPSSFPLTILSGILSSRVNNPSGFPLLIGFQNLETGGVSYEAVSDSVVISTEPSNSVDDTLQLILKTSSTAQLIASPNIRLLYTIPTASWLTLPTLVVDRSVAFPQFLTGIRANYLVDPSTVTTSVQLLGVDVAQISYDAANDRIVIAADPGTVLDTVQMRAVTTQGNVDSNAFAIDIKPLGVQSDLEAQWQSQILGADVSFYHDFRSDGEVNAFRWQGGFPGGNDPNNQSQPANSCARITTDGIRGACMRMLRPSGSGALEAASWWRPTAPILGTANGRGVDDPACGGTLPIRAWDPLSGIQSANYGWYGDPTYFGDLGAPFDGHEYYFQMWIKFNNADVIAANPGEEGGKLLYFTKTPGAQSATAQEINTILLTRGPNGLPSAQKSNIFNLYRSVGPGLYQDEVAAGLPVPPDQIGSELGICDYHASTNFCWTWPANEWVNLQYRIKAYLNGISGTIVEVWALTYSEMLAGLPHKQIWKQNTVRLPYDLGTSPHPRGHNALLATNYFNHIPLSVPLDTRYCGMIFSKAFIPQARPAPTVLAADALSLAPGAFKDSAIAKNPRNHGNDIEWQTISLMYDARHARLMYMGKGHQSDVDFHHYSYEEGTNTWPAPPLSVVTQNTGHAWANAIDPEEGDYFFHPWDSTSVWWYRRALNSWTTIPGLPGVNPPPAGMLCYHPNLYGNRDGGLIWMGSFNIYIWRKKTSGPWTQLGPGYGQFTTTGQQGGGGLYIEEQDTVYASMRQGSSGDLFAFTVGRGQGGIPPSNYTVKPDPPLDVRGGGGGDNRGHIVHDVVKPGSIMLLEQYGSSRVWRSGDLGSTWSLISGMTHPFNSMAFASLAGFIPCGIKQYRSVLAFTSQGGEGAGGFAARIWKPGV